MVLIPVGDLRVIRGGRVSPTDTRQIVFSEGEIEQIIAAGGGGFSVGGGGFSAGGGLTARQIIEQRLRADVEIQIEIRRRAEEQRLIDQARRDTATATLKASEELRISQATSFQEKTQIARQIVEQRQGRIEQGRIETERQRIISAGGQVTTKTSRDVRTGRQLIITTTTGRGGRKIRDVRDVEMGTTKTTTFAPPRGGGAARLTGGITTKEIRPVEEVVPVLGPVDIGQVERERLRREKIEREGFGFRIFPTEEEKGLSTADIIKGRFGEVGTGIVSAAAIGIEGIVNLVASLGVQTIEFDKEGKRIDKSFRFDDESFFGRARAEPTGTGKILGQALVFAPLVGGAIASFSSAVAQQGLKAATLETITSFTPLKIPTQTFGALQTASALDKLKFDVLSFKTIKGTTTGRVVVGKARDVDDVFLLSKQVLGKVGGKDIGFAVTDITAPKTTFRFGRFTEGIRTIRAESILFGTGGGPTTLISDIEGVTVSQLLGVTGGGARVFTRTRAVLGFDELAGIDFSLQVGGRFGPGRVVGAISKPVEDLTLFAGGRGVRAFKFEKDFGLIESVRVGRINIRGIELDISKFGGREQFGAGFVAGGKGSKLITESVTKQLSASLSDVTLLKTPPKIDTGLVAPVVSSILTKEETIFREPLVTTGEQDLAIIQKDLSKTELISLVDVRVDVGKRARQRITPALKLETKLDTKQRAGQRFIQDLELETLLDTKQDTRLRFVPRQKLVTEQILKRPSFTFFGTPRPLPPTKLPPIIPPFKLDRKRLGERIKEVELFTLEIRREGIFRPLGGDLTLRGALGLGARRTRKTLARTFKITPTGKRRKVRVDDDFAEPDLSVFREFKIVKGRRVRTPGTFIQFARESLADPGEVAEIQRFRREAELISMAVPTRGRKRKKLNLLKGLLD